MRSKIEPRPTEAASHVSLDRITEEYVCWSRMQAEAGQQLEQIIARKELERRAGDGLFFWGVGNAPAVIVKALVRVETPVRVVFSIMKSRPKLVDASPTRTVAWRRYIDAQGVDRPLPAHSLVVSRGDSAGGAKRSHYALMCFSDTPLALHHGDPFDPTAYRNAGSNGAPVGASQVTALLRRVRENASFSPYEANFTARLTRSYWVRLLDPVELDHPKQALLDDLSNRAIVDWCAIVDKIRCGQSSSPVESQQSAFL